MKKPVIKFSHNWNNKLLCPVFTTIRRLRGADEPPEFGSRKYKYYYNLIGKEFDVQLKKEVIAKATLISVQNINYSEIPVTIYRTDTGYVNGDDIRYLFSKFGVKNDMDEMLILTFSRGRK